MKKSQIVRLSATCLVLCGSLLTARAEEPKDPGVPAEALEEWRARRFGMFIHWGPVALTGHEIGWSRGRQTPTQKYDNLYKQFNPVKFDANEWARVAKEAGMTYMVITTKHHDGFCLWPSKFTDYDIGETPFKRDVLKELAEACKRHGIAFGTYYSVCDWYHPDFPLGSPGGRKKKPNPNLDGYVEFLQNQVTELIQNYGPLSTMWFDVPQEVHAAHGIPTVIMCRKLQPDLVINNRAYRGFKGDYSTPEQKIGGFNRDHAWETCMTICRQWAWKPNDTMKSKQQCLRTLITTVGGDGNLLFNVGPTAEGEIEARQIERLKEMGAWLKQYGDEIYGTRGGPFKPGKWGASTCNGKTVTLFVMNRPEDGVLQLPAIDAKIKKVETLTAGKASVAQTEGATAITLPAEPADEVADVIRLTLDQDAFGIEPDAVRHNSHSLAYAKPVKASNVFQKQNSKYGPAMALDDDPETRWATDAGVHAASLEVDLGKAQTVGRLHVDEREWNRVQKYQFEVEVDGAWRVAHSGTKMGAGHKASFKPVTGSRFRLNILQATDGPTLWEVHLLPPEKK